MQDEIKTLEEKKNATQKELAEINEKISKKLSEIEAKKRQLHDEEAGAVQVNKYLNDYFGHEFLTLQAEQTDEGGSRIRFQIIRNGSIAYNLSEGEKSLIAFCYFMAKLKDINTSDKKPIIWIDDPISSLDSSHVFFIYSLIRAEIVEAGKEEQLFVSTHNLNFLKYLKRLTGGSSSKKERYYMIHRTDERASIMSLPHHLQKFVTEFNFLFQEIYKCSQITVVNNSNYKSFYNFGNNARKFLEILLYYSYPDDSKDIKKLEKFFGDNKIPAILTDRVNNEYSHLSGIFERGEMPTEVPEMLKTARLIIDTIKNNNPEQYTALLKSIGEIV